jgi:hypothetical protein
VKLGKQNGTTSKPIDDVLKKYIKRSDSSWTRFGTPGKLRRKSWPEKSKNSRNVFIDLKEKTVRSRL